MNRLQKLFTHIFLVSNAQVSEMKTDTRAAGSLRFDWLMSIASIWLVTGGYLDLWAHVHNRVDGANIVLVVWHLGNYTGYSLILLVMTWQGVMNLRRGKTWGEVLPRGYQVSIAGALLYAIAAPSDLIWHYLFGLESGIEAIFSPTHVLLVVAWVMLFSGPFLAAWQRPGRVIGLRQLLPALLAIACILSAIAALYHHIVPIGNVRAVQGTLENSPLGDYEKTVGVLGFILYTLMFMSVTLLLVQRWTLPFGSLTVVLTFNMIEMSWAKDVYWLIPIALLTGLVSDVLYRVLKPSYQRVNALRLFASGMPALYFSLYFLTLALTDTIRWRIHLWAGAIFIAGCVGLVLSFIARPPALPVEAPFVSMVDWTPNAHN